MNRNSQCEIQSGQGWRLVSVEDAIALDPKELKRCPKCHGRVRVEKAGGKTPAHYEHTPKHDGCPHSFRFDGIERPHPSPVE